MTSGTSRGVCPEYSRLIAWVEGRLPPSEAEQLDAHIADCEKCELQLLRLEEESDELVRALASLPPSPDDEEAFQRVHEELLSRPEPFQGSLTGETTQALIERIPVGETLPLQLGNYELLEQIGAGAHGAVFRARHRRLDREVAIKLLLHAASSAVEDFLHEMRVIGKLDHPHIVRATDAGEHNGVYFLVMEFIPGVDVSTLLRQQGSLSIADACEITRQAALGLAFAHQHDLVHRDVKTSNLLFTAAGQVKLLDLGLATIASSPSTSDDTSGPRGTADYMAPEQWRESGSVSAKADVYSLGCTLFKLLTGAPPYQTLPEGCLSKEQAHIEAQIPSVTDRRPDVGSGLGKLLTKMLAKDPADRPGSATEVADLLVPYTQRSDLGKIAQQAFPDAQSSYLQSMQLGSSDRTDSFRKGGRNSSQTGTGVPRRTVLIGLASSSILFAGYHLISGLPRNRAKHQVWRQLAPISPYFLLSPEAPPRFIQQESATGEYTGEFESSGATLLQLGAPLRSSAFRWQVTLRRQTWLVSAGIFFRFRLEQPLPDPVLTFHAIELQNGNNTESTLTWSAYRLAKRRLETPVVFADARWKPLQENEPYHFEMVLGRSGAPELTVNGERFPQSAWNLSKEGREMAFTNLDQVRLLYTGRIGLFHHGGITHFGPSKIMYLDPRDR